LVLWEDSTQKPKCPTVEAGYPLQTFSGSGTIPAFQLGRSEVPEKLYEMVMGELPGTGTVEVYNGESDTSKPCDALPNGPNYPVRCVTYTEGIQFFNALSEMEALEKAYTLQGNVWTLNSKASGYRYPSSEEWELAAKQTLPEWFAQGASWPDACKVAHLKGCGTEGWSEVKTDTMRDLLGNVWEWVGDPSGASKQEAVNYHRGCSVKSDIAKKCDPLLIEAVQAEDRLQSQGLRLARNGI